MNIRNLSNPVTSIDVAKSTADKKEVKMSESHQDRDADGRQYEADQDQRPLNEEELEQAKEYLESLDNLKKSGLRFQVEVSNDMRIFLILSPEDEIIRRIPEHEMRQLIQAKSLNKGQIFSRAG